MKIGYVVPVDSNEIAKALIDFYENNREEILTKNIIVEKERFSWDKMTNAIYQLAN